VITDANPRLKTETITSGELGARFSHGAFEFGITGYRNELRDSVANVTIASGPGTFPGIGFVPAGGEGRRRLNLDRARVQGVAFSAEAKLGDTWSAHAQFLYNDARVRRASVAPRLTGLRLAQVPRHSASAGLTWKRGIWSLTPSARLIGEQYEDDLNTLQLASATVVDVSLAVQVGRAAEIFASAENLADRRIETGRSADGLVNVGTPRLLLVGFRLWR
jgi:outer membrane receptor protein involved in Fe transport